MALSERARRLMEPILATEPFLCAEDFDDIRDRWLAGRCPCCASTAASEDDLDGTEAEVVAEGVIVCGRCVANRHLDAPNRELLLLALLP